MLAFFRGLGVGLLCLLVFVLGVLFNVQFLNKKKQNESLNLTRNVITTSKVKADIFEANINFWANENLSTKLTLSGEEKQEIAMLFEKIMQKTAQQNLCVGGAYSLEPNFSYKDGLQIPKGQKLDASLKCEFKEQELVKFNELLSAINSILDNNAFIGVSVPTIRAKFSNKLIADTQESLYNKLLDRAFELESFYSQKLARKCELKAVNANSYHFNPALKTQLNSQSLSLPLVSEEEQSLSAVLNFACK